jgi:hypothetical protein
MTPEGKKRTKGCLFAGCITISVLALAVILATFFGYRYFKQMLTDFTEDKPAPLPTVQISAADLQQLQRRVADFKQAVHDGRATAPLVLNSDEINALIANDPQLSPIKGVAYIGIEGDHLKGQISLPMDKLGLPTFRGRYLNGSAEANVELRNGLLWVTPLSFVVKGKAVPDIYLQQMRAQNLAQDANLNPGVSNALASLQSVQITNGTLVIAPKLSK